MSNIPLYCNLSAAICFNLDQNMAECVQKFYLLHSFCNTSVLTFFFIFVAFFTMPMCNEISYLNCQKKRVSLSVPTINCIHALCSTFLQQDFVSFRGKLYLSHELLSFASFAIQGLWFCSFFLLSITCSLTKIIILEGEKEERITERTWFGELFYFLLECSSCWYAFHARISSNQSWFFWQLELPYIYPGQVNHKAFNLI